MVMKSKNDKTLSLHFPLGQNRVPGVYPETASMSSCRDRKWPPGTHGLDPGKFVRLCQVDWVLDPRAIQYSMLTYHLVGTRKQQAVLDLVAPFSQS
jgi:hypothetical protein